MLLAGCRPDTATATTPHRTGSSATTSRTTDSPAALRARLVAGAADEHSAHVSFYLGPADGGAHDDGPVYEMSGEGTETLSNGQTADLDMAVRLLGCVDARLVRSGTRLLVHLPPELDKTAKPWFVVSANSSNELVRNLSTQLQGYARLGSPDRYAAMAGQATGLQKVGAERLDGVSVTHYRMSVPTAALANGARTQATGTAGTAVTLELWTDDRDRLRKASYELGTPVFLLTVLLGDVDTPTTIAAPPASEINAN